MISQRQAQILAAIVKEYSQTGHPVGSEDLGKKYNFDFSAATIRNEMQALEEEGLIMQTHTSAGRTPTDKGYRYFVNRLLDRVKLSVAEQLKLKRELLRLQKQYLELGRGISRLLSETTQSAAFALLPSLEEGPEQVAVSGLSNVIDENASREEIFELARFLDELEVQGLSLVKKNIEEVETFIGREAPLALKISDLSMVVTRVSLGSRRQGLIGIIGLKRMKYERNISLLEYVSKLLSAGLGALIIVNLSALGGTAFGG